jgi:2-isopropylmalate synthase
MGKTEANRVIILDTTLRDGEKSLGAALRLEDKLEIAKQLARLGVDVIEAGYPALRGNNFEATRRIADEVRGPVITAIAAAKTDEVDRAWEAIKETEKPRLHLYLSVSDILQQRLFRLSREEGLRQTAEMVARAKAYCEDVEFTAHDFTRADLEYSCRMIEAAIEAGATTINLADTIGQVVPSEFEQMILTVRTSVKKIEQVVLSVHCHNNLGMAVANSLAALRAGARQVECSISGIGQPAGNAALEQVVMALEARRDYYGLETGINTDELLKTIEMVAKFTEVAV